MVNGLSNSYALVLLNIGIKKNDLQMYYDDAHELLRTFNENPDLTKFLSNTAVSKQERKNLLTDLFENQIDRDILYFLWVIIDFNRAREFIKIIKSFLAMCQKYLNIHYVLVTSAYPLSPDEVAKLKDALSKNMNLEKIYIHNHVDPSIIGGLRIKTHAVTIDDTIKGKLNLMRQNSFGSKGEQ